MIASQVNISQAILIPGWMSERELTWLASAAQSCKVIVEFGSFKGRSTRALADNSPDDCKIFAVDPWCGEYPGVYPPVNTYVMPEFLANLADHIATGKVIPIREYSECFDTPLPVDMCFIDGDHRHDPVLRDIAVARKLVIPGGIISGHDYDPINWPGVVSAVNKAIYENVHVEDTIWWTWKQ